MSHRADVVFVLQHDVPFVRRDGNSVGVTTRPPRLQSAIRQRFVDDFDSRQRGNSLPPVNVPSAATQELDQAAGLPLGNLERFLALQCPPRDDLPEAA